MKPGQLLSDLTARVLTKVYDYLERSKPSMVLVQGDTTTVFAAALAAFYHQIPVGHIEAGLRTHRKYSPYPEEINRQIASRIADVHFAPTQQAKENLLREGVEDERICITGNTVIDALMIAKERISQQLPPIPGLSQEVLDSEAQMVLITGHRRENFGEGIRDICEAIRTLAKRFPDTHFVYPVHLNPNVQEPVHRLLADLRNVHLIEPLSYLPFVRLMDRSYLVLTDSGGIQEEAPGLGKPVLVMRDTTERPEGVEAGTVKLVGTGSDVIVDSVSHLLTDTEAYTRMATAVNPYGDGTASSRILEFLRTPSAGLRNGTSRNE